MSLNRFRLLSRFRDFVARLFGSSWFGGGDRWTDPRAGVRAPRTGRPSGRSSAVALIEPDDKPDAVIAIGRRNR